jgi:hypothetical protein
VAVYVVLRLHYADLIYPTKFLTWSEAATPAYFHSRKHETWLTAKNGMLPMYVSKTP